MPLLDLQTLHDIVSGNANGIRAAAIRGILGCLTPVYRLGLWWQNRKYPHASRSVDAPVISVGNLTTGGTGKTPMVVWLCRHLRDQNLRVAIVSRGYKSNESGVNDEALELETRLPDVPHLQDPDRVKIATIAIEELESQLIVLDDGFQHRRLKRDLDIVLIDATCPFGYGRMLPRGLLREPVSALRRCDAVVITRADQVEPETVEAIRKRVSSVHDKIPIATGRTVPTGFIQADYKLKPVSTLSDEKCFVFSAIGNPAAFEKSMEQWVDVVGHQRFPDHHHFTRNELVELAKTAKQAGATTLVCTHKDLVKVATHRIENLPVWAMQIDFEPIHGKNELIELVNASIDDSNRDF